MGSLASVLKVILLKKGKLQEVFPAVHFMPREAEKPEVGHYKECW